MGHVHHHTCGRAESENAAKNKSKTYLLHIQNLLLVAHRSRQQAQAVADRLDSSSCTQEDTADRQETYTSGLDRQERRNAGNQAEAAIFSGMESEETHGST